MTTFSDGCHDVLLFIATAFFQGLSLISASACYCWLSPLVSAHCLSLLLVADSSFGGLQPPPTTDQFRHSFLLDASDCFWLYLLRVCDYLFLLVLLASPPCFQFIPLLVIARFLILSLLASDIFMPPADANRNKKWHQSQARSGCNKKALEARRNKRRQLAETGGGSEQQQVAGKDSIKLRQRAATSGSSKNKRTVVMSS